MENTIIDAHMQQLNLTSSTNNCAVGPSSILVGHSYQQALTKNQQALASSHTSQNRVGDSRT
jgi:hypothetical protein